MLPRMYPISEEAEREERRESKDELLYTRRWIASQPSTVVFQVAVFCSYGVIVRRPCYRHVVARNPT
ncbi:hypothetical protein K449DRAFT_386962 [Hypoxylon sp. EC38]|nr:hypothetical protein K449DRAFT_386962 [Hypoxylon sp. EC38]